MKRKFSRIFYLPVLSIIFLSLACNSTKEKKDTTADYKTKIIGSWKMKDIQFMYPVEDSLVDAMNQQRLNIISQGVVLTFNPKNNFSESMGGNTRMGQWGFANDSTISIQYADSPDAKNVLRLDTVTNEQLIVIVGQPSEESKYIFQKQQSVAPQFNQGTGQ